MSVNEEKALEPAWSRLQPSDLRLRVSSDGRYFLDGQGRPFFWLGDTAWPLYAQYTRAEAEAYLRHRARLGFTVIQGVLAWGGGTGFESPLPGPNAAGDLPWLSGPERPNEAYFRHVDHLVAFAADQGLILGMLPTWGYYVNDVGTLNPENAWVYGRWLGERYRDAPNIVWINGGDRIPTGHKQTWRALALGLREGDGGTHLITYHPCGWRSSAQFWHAEAWLDFNMIETWTQWPKIYPAVAADAQLAPTKPVVLGEPAYENGPEYPLGPITPLIVRRQAWWSLMAGGFFTYGQDQMWRMGPDWADTFDTPGAAQMGVMRRIVESRRWWEMVPDQSVFDSGVGSERTLNAARRSWDSSCILIYLASQCHVRIHLDKVLTREVKATWIDPRSGEMREIGTYATGNQIEGRIFPAAEARWFSVPGHWEDAVLLLDGVDES